MATIDLMALVEQAVRANEKALTDLNRDQLRHGLQSEGGLIYPDLQNEAYADAKKMAGGMAPFGVPDLYLTGSFQGEMQMEVDSRSYSFFSTDEKTPDLADKYKNIFGLTKENKEIAKVINTATLGKLYKNAVGL